MSTLFGPLVRLMLTVKSRSTHSWGRKPSGKGASPPYETTVSGGALGSYCIFIPYWGGGVV